MYVCMLECTQLQEHVGSCYMRILQTPLACKIRLALLVVNSVKLHLTAYKCDLSPKRT